MVLRNRVVVKHHEYCLSLYYLDFMMKRNYVYFNTSIAKDGAFLVALNNTFNIIYNIS